MGKLLNTKNIYKIIAIGALALLILGIIPLIYIGRYAHPCADDFTYGYYTHAIWSTTKSLPQTLQWAFRQVKITYDTWQGTFSSAFLMALSPAIWGEEYYFLSPIILIGMMVLAYFSLGYVILVKLLRTSKSIWVIISSLVTFLIIETVPSPVNAYYWYNGAVHYNFMHSCMILLFAAMLSVENGFGRVKEILLYIAACILSVLCGGSNYSTALIGFLGLTFLIGLKWLLGQRKLWKLLPWGIYAFSFYKNVTAFGNTIRQSNFTQESPVKAVADSFIQGVHWSRHWFTLQIVLFVLLLIPFLWKAMENTRFKFPVPVVVSALSLCAVSCMFTPSLYAMGGSGPDRLINIIKMWFCLLLFVNEGYWLGYIRRKVAEGRPVFLHKMIQQVVQHVKRNLIVNKGLSRKAVMTSNVGIIIYTAAILCLLFISFVVNVETRQFDYGAYAAYVSLKAGEAQTYDREYEERLEILNGPDKEVTLKPFSVKPWLLCFDDITEDAADWRNGAVANWYYKNSVVLGE